MIILFLLNLIIILMRIKTIILKILMNYYMKIKIMLKRRHVTDSQITKIEIISKIQILLI